MIWTFAEILRSIIEIFGLIFFGIILQDVNNLILNILGSIFLIFYLVIRIVDILDRMKNEVY